MATSPEPSPLPETPPGTPDPRRSERAADAVWRRLADGLTAAWLDEVRGLRTDCDNFEATLDIWTVALTAELKNPAHKEDAGRVLTRLITFAEGVEDPEEVGSPEQIEERAGAGA